MLSQRSQNFSSLQPNDNIAQLLDRYIYLEGCRVVIKFEQDLNPDITAEADPHFVWVVGRDGTDWKLADGGWKSANPRNAIASLNGHLTGFSTTGRSGTVTHRKFNVESLRVLRNRN